jgi:hypothetical protein
MPVAKLELNKAALFARLGYEPHPGQWEIHKSRHRRRAVACGVRWGKTLCAAMEAIVAALSPAERSFGWICAPTYDLARKVFREVQHYLLRSFQHRIVAMRDSDHVILVRNMACGISEIRGKSADNPVSLLGEGLDWLVVDEASRLRPDIWQSHLSQRLVDKKGWAILISTPRGRGWFYDLCRAGRGSDRDTKSWNFPSWTNPTLDKALIEQERERLPERVFRQEYGAEFLEGSGAVFRYVRDRATGSFQEPQGGSYYHAGLDLGRVEDFTVLVIVNRRREVVFVDRFQKIDWRQQVERVGHHVRRYGARVRVDCTGLGDPIYEALRNAGINAEGYQLSMRSKMALIDSLARLLERNEIVLPRP